MCTPALCFNCVYVHTILYAYAIFLLFIHHTIQRSKAQQALLHKHPWTPALCFNCVYVHTILYIYKFCTLYTSHHSKVPVPWNKHMWTPALFVSLCFDIFCMFTRLCMYTNMYCHSHNNWGSVQVFQRFSSNKLVIKTVESTFVALNYYENGSINCTWLDRAQPHIQHTLYTQTAQSCNFTNDLPTRFPLIG